MVIVMGEKIEANQKQQKIEMTESIDYRRQR
jgi:hypothetical protein